MQVAIKNWSSSFKNTVYAQTSKSAKSLNIASDAMHHKSVYFRTLYDVLI